MPLLKQTGGLKRDAIYWHYPHYHKGGATPSGAVRKGNFKLIEYFEDGRLELFDLKADIGEENDLSKKLPKKAEELQKLLAAWRAEVDASMPTPNPDYKPE
jgi:arylsulfatase A-like enzyme